MHSPTDREQATRTVTLKIKAINLDITMLQDFLAVLNVYKRKQINKYLIDALKEKQINFWHDYGFANSDSYQISNINRVLHTSAPDRNGVSTSTYRDTLTVFVDHLNQADPPSTTEIDKLKLAVSQRLEGLIKERSDLSALLLDLPATLDRFDTLSKELEAIRDIPGFWCLSNLLPRI